MKWFCRFSPFIIVIALSSAQSVTKNEAYSVLTPAPRTAGKQVNPSGLKGRVMTGYQGWFRAEGDGAGMGFSHYTRRGKFEPGYCSIDLWPDMSEYGADERYDTPFKHRGGKTAQVFSSVNPKTVNRHFKWMKEYGIDGAFVQRFASVGAKERRSYQTLQADNQKLMNCRAAANANGRAYALMYDLSGLKSGDFERLNEDWKKLRTKMKLGQDPNDRAYLQLNGKPLVAIWGVGFTDDREYSVKDAEKFIRLLKHNPEWGGMSVMLGVPFAWREGKRDSVPTEELHPILKLADVISPWAVGRYHSVDFKKGTHVAHLVEDRKWCEENKIEYLPVIFPGFSWHNMRAGEAKLGAIPRRQGKFYWDQFVAVRAAGVETAYVAMFDEVDEATAIFKISNDPPVGKGVSFLRNEGLPSDHYLKLSEQGGELLRGEVPAK